MNLRTPTLLIAFVISFIAHSSFAQTCGAYLSGTEEQSFDKVFVEQLVDSIREDRDFLKKSSLEQLKIMLLIFKRYESVAKLTSSEILTLAVVQFNITDDPNRALKAIKKVREIRPSIQFRHNRLLAHLADFLIATKIDENLDAAIRIKALIQSRVAN